MPFSKNPRKCEELKKFKLLPGGHIIGCSICSNTLLDEYFLWLKIRRRCHSKNDKNYKDYGAKGISLWTGWRDDFAAFYRYIGPKTGDDYTLKRLNVKKDYEPGNVSWRKIGEPRNPDVVPKYLRPEYNIWEGIVQRCCNPKSDVYVYYGGRGIRICDRWRYDSDAFLEDMGPRPSPKHSIDRIDVNGHYEPNNTRWASPKEQARNTRRNRFVEYEGRMITLAELIEIVAPLGISQSTIHHRALAGLTGDDLIAPVRKTAVYPYKGQMLTVKELAKVSGLTPFTIEHRLSTGWSMEDVVEKPIQGSAIYDYKGELVTIKELAVKSGLPYATLTRRLRNNDVGDALLRAPGTHAPK